MSDNESDYYDSNSNSSDSEEESVHDEVVKRASKPVGFNHVKQFRGYDEDQDEDDNDNDDAFSSSDNDSDDENSENEEDDDAQVGGVEDDPDEDDDDADADQEESEDEDQDDEDEGAKRPAKQTRVRKAVPQLVMDDDEEDEDEYDENYLQKFERSMTNIFDFHPETKMHNHDEVKQLARVVRDEFGNIVDPLHRTLPYLSKYEKTRVLGQRARQIEIGATPFIKVPENIIDGYVIAELELREKKLPFILRRPIPSGGFEYWHLRDLEDILF